MGPGENTPSFIILFTDLSIILLAFLIFLNALAVPNIEKRVNAIRSVGEQFTGTLSLKDTTGAQHNAGYAPNTLTQLPKMSMSTRYSKLASLAEEGGIAHREDKNRFFLTLLGEKLFTSESHQIRAAFLPLLRDLAEEIKNYPLFASVSVHSAPSSPRSSNPYAHSNAEAASLLRFLLDSGVPAEKFEVSGFGGFQPAFSNDTEEGRSKNHRVEISFTWKESSKR